jgi:hypothetical protein
MGTEFCCSRLELFEKAISHFYFVGPYFEFRTLLPGDLVTESVLPIILPLIDQKCSSSSNSKYSSDGTIAAGFTSAVRCF